MGIGGSKHTVEHMLSINGLNICHDVVDFIQMLIQSAWQDL